MKKFLFAASVVSLCGFVGGVCQAQTCEKPLALKVAGSTGKALTGDTCSAANALPTYGGTGSPQKETIYSFVAGKDSNISSIAVEQKAGFEGSTAGLFLLPACTASTDPIAFGAPGTAMKVDASLLTAGQTYYVVVTADPGASNTGCGQYSVTVSGEAAGKTK